MSFSQSDSVYSAAVPGDKGTVDMDTLDRVTERKL
eukprot:SAG25_NODE_5141_length_697_cov_1.192308_1_plen_34_part_10